MYENINYFSQLDDYSKINKLLQCGENNAIEFKSTFGFPINKVCNGAELKNIKNKIIDKIAQTILSMANADGGAYINWCC